MATRKIIYFMQRAGTLAEKGQLQNIMRGRLKAEGKQKKGKGVKGFPGWKKFDFDKDDKDNLTMEVIPDGTSFDADRMLRKVKKIFNQAHMEAQPIDDGADGAGASGSSK